MMHHANPLPAHAVILSMKVMKECIASACASSSAAAWHAGAACSAHAAPAEGPGIRRDQNVSSPGK